MILQKIKQYLFFEMILKIAMDKANYKQNKLTQKLEILDITLNQETLTW